MYLDDVNKKNIYITTYWLMLNFLYIIQIWKCLLLNNGTILSIIIIIDVLNIPSIKVNIGFIFFYIFTR